MSVVDLKASVTSATELSVVITLEGEMDLTSAPIVADLVEAALEGGSPTVVLDMSGVSFADSQALHALMRAENRARDAGVGLELRSPSRRVLQLLRLAGADGLFSISLPSS
jgi:anti-anti-sigma factor